MNAVEGVQTFLIADIRGYTRYTAEHGDESAAELASRFADIVDRVVTERDGRLIELRGDEALVAFASARQAIRAAIELQAETQELPRGIGIGLDAGEAVPVAEGYRGGALNLAARLCSLAGPGEVLASQTVVQLARTIDGIRYGARRTERVKGIAEPVTAIEVHGPQSAEQAQRLRQARRRAQRLLRRREVRIAGLVALVALVVIAAILALGARGTSSGAGGVRLLPNSLASIDPVSHGVLADSRVGGKPWSVVTGSGRAWALSHNGRVVTSVARSGHGLHNFGLRGTAAGQWAGAGTVDTANDFVALAGSNTLTEVSQAIGGDTGAALPLRSSITPWRPAATDAECAPYVTGSGSVVWFSRGRRLAKIDGATGLVVQTYTLPQATSAPRSITCYGVGYFAGRLLASRSPDGSIGAIDAAAGTFRPIVTGASGVTAASGSYEATPWAATAHSLWLAAGNDLLNVNLETGKTVGRVPIGRAARIAIGPTGAVLALGQEGHELVQIDPATGSVVARIPLAVRARDVAGGLGRIWLALGSG